MQLRDPLCLRSHLDPNAADEVMRVHVYLDHRTYHKPLFLFLHLVSLLDLLLPPHPGGRHTLFIALSQQGSICLLTLSRMAHHICCWWVYKLESCLAALTKVVVLKCRCLCSPGDICQGPEICLIATTREMGAGGSRGWRTEVPEVLLNIPQRTQQPPTRGHPARMKHTSMTQQSYPRCVCPREMMCTSIKNTSKNVVALFIKASIWKQSKSPLTG